MSSEPWGYRVLAEHGNVVGRKQFVVVWMPTAVNGHERS
jgi:hypothetical protein